MKRILVLAVCTLLAGAGRLAAQEPVVAGGSGEVLPVMQELANAYRANNPADRVEVMSNSLGSTGGIKAAEAGRVTIGLTARALRPEEKESGKLVRRVIGRMPVVVAVHQDVRVSKLNESQVCEIFGGKITSWKALGGADSMIVVLTRDEDDSSKLAVRGQMPCFNGLQESAGAIVLTKAPEMVNALSIRPSTIGLTDLGATIDAQGRFKPVAIGGITPSVDTVRTGKYRLFKEFGVVTLGEPQGVARRFLDFIASREGERILRQKGVAITR